jgi:uncharacterized membrane protein
MELLWRVARVLPWADWFALIGFFAAWVGYIAFARWHGHRVGGSLLYTAQSLRLAWMLQTTRRDNRMVDAVVVNNLSSSPSFFASTTIFIIGGLAAALGAGDKTSELMLELPFAARTSALVLELKLLVLTAVYVIAFFRFTWAMRQYTFGALMVAAAPEQGFFPGHEDERERYARHASRMLGLAAETFNDGLRAVYLSFAVVVWLLSPLAFAVATAGVIFVLYRREFHSEILAVMRDYGPPPG